MIECRVCHRQKSMRNSYKKSRVAVLAGSFQDQSGDQNCHKLASARHICYRRRTELGNSQLPFKLKILSLKTYHFWSQDMKIKPFVLLTGSLFFAVAAIAPAHAAVDEDAAKALSKKNDCFKCHAIDKTKKGPSYKKVAAKYKDKDKAEAQEKIIKSITTGPKVKLEDGTEENHKKIEADPKELANIVQWILSR
jgi:cytochrome c